VPPRPLVSVCMPAYNAARWIGQAIDSVLAQTYPELELVVSDNASTDDTAAIVRSYDDPRIRLETTSTLIPPVENHNRSVSLSRGGFVKFLHADDLLMPSCLEEMLAVALEDDHIGLVFAPREILLDDAEDEENLAWQREHERLTDHFAQLSERNEGRALFREILASGIESNWVGEPSAVMASRACLDEVGLFNVRLRQIADLDLWLRIMLSYDVGYLSHPLSAYRHHAESVTATNARLGRDWLDRLWLLESLAAEPSLTADERASVVRLRSAALRRAVRSQARHLAGRRFWSVGDLLAYGGYRTRSVVTPGSSPRPRPSPPTEREPLR
jgi:glycosyltransferase involved in cell wall biosynthesis